MDGTPKIVGFPPKSSVLMGFSIINHPFWGTPIFGNTQMLAASNLEEFFRSHLLEAWRDALRYTKAGVSK